MIQMTGSCYFRAESIMLRNGGAHGKSAWRMPAREASLHHNTPRIMGISTYDRYSRDALSNQTSKLQISTCILRKQSGHSHQCVSSTRMNSGQAPYIQENPNHEVRESLRCQFNMKFRIEWPCWQHRRPTKTMRVMDPSATACMAQARTCDGPTEFNRLQRSITVAAGFSVD
ncbi:MAG: hypothetical protein K0R57_2668 [Paenibacillaceae bacterium]|jgi:hypothetical protein|nr:hypothetical protein [Paenibacillaceae bacterium]